ncbi:MAG: DUF6456 domain-containing protein [Pseudomonadota bacterium]
MSNTQTVLQTCTQAARQAFPDPTTTPAARDAALYLAHTECGQSIRALAQAAGAHPSTVLRAVRRIEARRDDPLFDRLMGAAGANAPGAPLALEAKAEQPVPIAPLAAPPAPDSPPAPDCPDDDAVNRAARSVLRRLSEPGAFLLVTPGAAKGGVFCAANGHRKPICLVPVAMAAEFLRRDWIVLLSRSEAAARYRLSEPGRAALKRLLAEDRAAQAHREGARGATNPFHAQHTLNGQRRTGPDERVAVNLGESPLGWLARRRGSDGVAFLSPDEVEAGERLRADFEIAQLGPSIAQDWRRFLAPAPTTGARATGDGAARARERVSAALSALGPGLSDVAFRVCCFLEGLEACEKRMGWSARSGKVVLKIALQRLSEHYGLKDFGA